MTEHDTKTQHEDPTTEVKEIVPSVTVVLQGITKHVEPKEVTVDLDDAWILHKWKWRVDEYGYARRKTSTRRAGAKKGDAPVSRTEYLHRTIMGYKYGDPIEIDHIDRDPTNNRRINLRPVSGTENKSWARKHGRQAPWVDLSK